MKEARMLRALLAAVVLGMIVTPIAVAGAQDGTFAKARSGKSVQKMLQGLKRETAAIAGEVAALRTKIGTLETPQQGPPSLPAGPAGGDLTGSFPNPKVRANSITGANVVDGTLTSADIAGNAIQSFNIADGAIESIDLANGAVGQADLAPASVGAGQVVGTHVVVSEPEPVGGSNTAENGISCGPGERLLSGGAEWRDANRDLFILYSKPNFFNPNQWIVFARNNSGVANAIVAYALCLNKE